MRFIRIVYITLLGLLFGVVAGDYNLFAQKIKVDNPRFPRKAMTFPDCVVNASLRVVSVLEGEKGLNNLLDHDLNNTVSFRAIADVKLFEDVVVRIKDRKHIYPKGTIGGFCVQSKSEGGLLSLDVLKVVNIGFYLNGKLVKTVPVKESSEGNKLLGLQLIQFGGNEAATTISAESPCEFDEIGLFYGGVSLSVINAVKVRYGFVGDNIESKLINDNGKEPWVKIINDSGLAKSERIIDSDLDNHATLAAVVVAVPVNLVLKTTREFSAGSEVGFVYFNADVLSLPLGESFLEVSNSKGETRKINLDPSLLKVGLLSFGRVRMSIISPIPFNQVRLHQPGGVGIGGGEYYYGFVNEAPEVNLVQDLGLSMDAQICETQSQYQLYSKRKVKWEIVSHPSEDKTVTVDPVTGAVSNMALNVTGDYEFKATLEEDPTCVGYVRLHRGVKPDNNDCNQPVSSEKNFEAYSPEGISGGILIWQNMKNPANIVDPSMDTYAEYENVLSLLDNTAIIGIKNTKDNISDGTVSKRVGFVMEVPVDVLNVGLLKTFQIRVKNKEGKEIYKALIDRSNLLSVGLIGAQKSYKMRYSIEVPASKGCFDRFELWSVGLLELKLKSLRIYGAFVEDVSTICDDPLGCDSYIVGSSGLDEASINYEGTKLTGVVNVGAFWKDLENVIDENLDSYATFEEVLSVGGMASISVRLGKVMDKTHQLGVVIDQKTFLANISLIHVIKMELLRDGVTVGHPKNTWNVLGADVIGYGDKSMLMMNSSVPFDEVRLTIGDGVSALNGMHVYGVFIRNDSDGDGIPDCVDPESCGSSLVNVKATDHICLSDQNIEVTGEIVNLGDADSKTYRLTYSGDEPLSFEQTVTKEKVGLVTWPFGPFTKPGRFQLYVDEKIKGVDNQDVYDRVAEYSFDVHPNETSWKTEPINDNWNEWENWDKGSPWTCTNVIITKGAAMYPILTEREMNGCNMIHFEPNTEVANTHYLSYNKAWVDMELSPDRYYMLSAPLKGMFSGDMFISGNEYPAYFTDLNETNYPQKRVNPTIYQRLWEMSALNRPMVGDYAVVVPAETRWTKPYNHLATLYDLREDHTNAFSLWVDPGKSVAENSSYLFRFPKRHEVYNYYNSKGELIDGKTENLIRNEMTGRFIYERSKEETNPFPLKVVLKNRSFSSDNRTYLMGNPFMAHLDIQKFLEKNQHIASVKVYDGNTNNSIVADKEEGLLSSNSGLRYIAPVQSVFLEQKSNTEEISNICEVLISEDMLVANVDKIKTPQTKFSSGSVRITAEAEGRSSSALVNLSGMASDEVIEGEDAELLLENEARPAVAVFTVNDGKALDIEQRSTAEEINLGFYMVHPADVNLQITLPSSAGDKVLEDRLTGKTQLLPSGEMTTIFLKDMGSQAGRFRIVDRDLVSDKKSAVVIMYRHEKNAIEVRSCDGKLACCEVYTIDGRCVAEKKYPAEVYHIPVPSGIIIVHAITQDGEKKVVKMKVESYK